MASRIPDALDKDIKAYWDERAESYSNGVRGELGDERRDAWRLKLEDALSRYASRSGRDISQAHVLDLGCGPGFFSVLLAEMGCRVDSVDASGEMIARATSNVHASANGHLVKFHQGDVSTLPFPDDSFDMVASRNLMWLMRDPTGAYAEWLRVLRPGGVLVVFDANWYRYLVDSEVDARRRADQEGSCVEEWDEDSRASTAEERRCEAIAAELPLTSVLRPAWDVEVLTGLGADGVRVDEGAWVDLWTESESGFYASSPLFMVEAVKGAS